MTANAWEYAARTFERADRWMYDPVAWVNDVIDWPVGQHLTGYQEEVLSALPVKRRVAVRGPHGIGKTATIAFAVLWHSTTRDMAGIDWKVLTTASAWRQLTLFAWPEIRLWARRVNWDRLGRAPFDRRELLDLHLKLGHGAASAVASNDPAKIEGAHASSLLYIYDEAKTIPAGTWDAAEGAFSGGHSVGLPEAFALAMSTPGAPSGRFYDIHKRARGTEDWHTKHVTLADAVKAGRVSADWAAQRATQWGEDSAIYQNRVLGEFWSSDELSVMPLSWVEAAVERWHVWNDAGRPPLEGRHILGVDVARGGSDSTVIAHRIGPCVVGLTPHHQEDTMRTTARVQAALSGLPEGALAVVDSIGVGGGVVDRLRELEVAVLPYTGSARTTARTRDGEHGFSAVRSAAYWHLRELLDPTFGSDIMLPPDDLLLADLNAPTWTEVTGIPPKIQVERKEDLVARLGRSPDAGDSVAMAFWADALRREVSMGVASGAMPSSSVSSPLGAGLGGASSLGPLG
jgi:hypothetical protein